MEVKAEKTVSRKKLVILPTAAATKIQWTALAGRASPQTDPAQFGFVPESNKNNQSCSSDPVLVFI
jgi:hypothetical protein